MPTLHVAAMPFPSVQGTQAAVRAMVDAEHGAGRAPELLTYAHGGFELQVPWPHHRIADLTRDRSLRSGPSLRKVVEDAQLVLAARRTHARLRPTRTFAHHVEAGAACLAARVPFVFVAHTALEPELPAYLPAAWARIASRAGGALDTTLVKRAEAAVAVSPWLAEHLGARASREVTYAPVPWIVPAPLEPEEREKARARFGFGAVEPVVLYAGNLDAYQGLETLTRAFGRLRERRPAARLLIATASDPEPLERALWSAGHADHARFAPLGDEPDRRVAHAAADVAWVPRGVEGGLPMKLLDALARAVPTVVSAAPRAGLSLEECALVAPDDDPEAFAASSWLLLEGREAAVEIGRKGRDHVRVEHSPEAWVGALDEAI